MYTTKDLDFQVKSMSEAGEFTGLLSVYDVVDEGGDVVERGAFTKTLAEGGGSVPLLWAHDTREPIGTLSLTDSPTALQARGKLEMSVTRAREIHALMKAGAIKGLSIGFRVIKEQANGTVRRLKELKLYEGSLTAFPMNPAAVVTSVKESGPDMETLDAFRNAERDLKDFHRRMIDGE